ncbi:MAG: hypothetical protein EOO47_27130, partial [Flavobacterium sp.]
MKIRKPSDPRPTGESKSFYIFRLLPYWPMFLILFIIAIIVSLLYLKITPSVYEANARIQINERKGDDEIKSSDPMASSLSTKQTVDNEREIIVSNPILYKVVEDLGLYTSVYRKETLSSKVIYKNSPLKIIVQNPNTLIP